MSKKVEDSLLLLEKLKVGMKKHRSIDRKFANSVYIVIEKHISDIKSVRGLFKIDAQFYNWYIEDMGLRQKSIPKEENNLYKNFKRLKRFNLIHQRSFSFFPKSLTLISINPNHFSLQAGDLSQLDSFIEAKTNLEKNLLVNPEKIYYSVYCYLRLFHIYPLSKKILSNIYYQDIIFLPNGTSVLLIQEPLVLEVQNSKMYKCIVLDKTITRALSAICKEKEKSEIIFDEISKFEDYIYEIKKYQLNDMNLQMIKYLNRNYYLFSQSPIELTIKSKIIQTVGLTLSDIDSKYPNVLSKELLDIEKERRERVFSLPERIEDERDNSDVLQVDLSDVEALADLLKIKGNNFTEDNIDEVVKEIHSYLKHNESMHTQLIFEYVLYRLDALKRGDFVLTTLKGYLGIINKHLFHMVEDLEYIQPYELDAISQRLENFNYKNSSVKKIYSQIKDFFQFHGKDKPFLADITSLFYPKSMVMSNELDLILEIGLRNLYKEKHAITRVSAYHKFDILQQKILVLCGFYFGLRRNELRTRLIEDIYYYDDIVYIDVNEKGLKKEKLTLKTSSAKRRVKSKIKNKEHLTLITNWIKVMTENREKDSFLFPKLGDKGVITDDIMDESVFNDINIVIKNTTKRYCTFHSLRHSFATYRYAQLLKETTPTPYDLLQLSMQLGHETPEISLSSYIHADMLEIL